MNYGSSLRFGCRINSNASKSTRRAWKTLTIPVSPGSLDSGLHAFASSTEPLTPEELPLSLTLPSINGVSPLDIAWTLGIPEKRRKLKELTAQKSISSNGIQHPSRFNYWKSTTKGPVALQEQKLFRVFKNKRKYISFEMQNIKGPPTSHS
nr:hypothetical protein Iba_scaffold6395CG0510 [Ipomoea batatas]